MSVNAFPLVVPVIDYEPPTVGSPGPLPAARPARPRRRVCPTPARPKAEDPRVRAAAVFADAALRRVLEVIDRRRPAAQLRPLLAAGLADSLLPMARRSESGSAIPARLRRVMAQLVGPGAAEVSASYSRGERVHAIACRIEQVSTPTGPRWLVVALHMG